MAGDTAPLIGGEANPFETIRRTENPVLLTQVVNGSLQRSIDPASRTMPGLWAAYRQPTAAGSVKENVAPPSTFASAHSRPPCDSMIERLIDSPMPVPCGFVVKNAWKI